MKEIIEEEIKKPVPYRKKIKKINEQFNSIITSEEDKVNSKINLIGNEKKKNKKKRKDSDQITMKEISKDALNLLKEKVGVLSDAFENNEIKEKEEETVKKKDKFIKKGFVSQLLLNDKPASTNYKLALSRKKTRLEQYIHTQYLFNCQVQALLAMTTILTSVLEYENTVLTVAREKVIHTFEPYEYEANIHNLTQDHYNKLRRISRICSFITFTLSIFLWVSIYYDKILFHILLKGYKAKTYKIILTEKKQLFRLFYSIFFFFLCPNPFTYGIEINFYNDYYAFKYKIPLNSIFTSIALFRIWFIFKLYLVSSISYSQRSFRIAKMNGVKLGLKFPFKANMADNSLKINVSLFMICLLVFSYDLRIYERYFDELNENNLGNYLNNLWCIFITMTTVGYGDISPKSFFGRLISVVTCMFGVFLVGLVVISVTSYFNLEGIESNVYKIILKSKKMEKRNKYAYNSIVQYLRSIKEIKKQKSMMLETHDDFMNDAIINEKKKINDAINEFKLADIDFLSTIPSMNEYDNIGEHIRFLEENMNTNREKIKEISDLIEQLNTAFHNI
jgi:hypothetical protein